MVPRPRLRPSEFGPAASRSCCGRPGRGIGKRRRPPTSPPAPSRRCTPAVSCCCTTRWEIWCHRLGQVPPSTAVRSPAGSSRDMAGSGWTSDSISALTSRYPVVRTFWAARRASGREGADSGCDDQVAQRPTPRKTEAPAPDRARAGLRRESAWSRSAIRSSTSSMPTLSRIRSAGHLQLRCRRPRRGSSGRGARSATRRRRGTRPR